MSVSLRSGARKLQRLPPLKYNLLKWESRFNLELNAAQKCFKYKLLSIKFLTKKSDFLQYFPQEWSYGTRKIDMSQILYCAEMGK